MQESESILDDPIWEYTVVTKLMPYLPAIRRWWENYDKLKIVSVGIFPIEYDDIECPPGLQMRICNTPVRSPIKHVQAFPFVPTAYLQIIGVPGGVNKMIERVCHKGLKLEEFTIIEKHNLPSTCQSGQWLGFVPTEIFEGTKSLGKYIYFTLPELMGLAQGNVLNSVILKCARYLE